MARLAGLADLFEHLERSTGMDPPGVARVVEEVLAYFGESVEEFVRRRHEQLQADHLKNDAIFAQIERELGGRRFCARALTRRQLRRMVYG